ncbi:hypothetical protein BC939DRAFT_438825 [Gamsiella multidivaricata]|uniref:uncharacterized protein n=1 Tax=Gamsiella multidivaricata TaxID=101098 RepID=UPI002220C77B|nr:uncharacterized protein BC939DRAFT_438825 [Gamsiella multidivaricata]KAI7830708.1 hypothetical protein BC939DRAFT_438825 [Gamsiella multidivaricata]
MKLCVCKTYAQSLFFFFLGKVAGHHFLASKPRVPVIGDLQCLWTVSLTEGPVDSWLWKRIATIRRNNDNQLLDRQTALSISVCHDSMQAPYKPVVA